MDLNIAGRTALVLCAGGGLGGAIAEALAQEGANLALADISEESLAETTKAVKRFGVSAISVVWDLADLEAIDRNTGAIEEALGPVDILVNITGGPPPTPVAMQPPTSWQEYFNSMILPVIAITDRVMPAMRERSWGRIITSTSSGVLSPIPNLGISNTLRSSLLGWSKTLAGEVAADGVTVNVVVPGRIATQRIKSLDESKAKREQRQVAEVSRDSTASIPCGRYGEPGEYAAVVAFLASANASYVTGSTIRVDGGMVSGV